MKRIKGNASTKERKNVYVGLSGGVDSSVSAALLKEAGYDVTGVFIRVWQPEFLECTWPHDRLDAMRVCAQLGIPFKTLDLSKEYKRDVADYMISEYRDGRTPNPDVVCNQRVKFGTFLSWAREEGAEYVATGHYAQREERAGGVALKKSADSEKDQTYFLWTLTQKQLSRILFPVGGFVKRDVRKMAEERDLITATKKDSQGVCFVGKLDMKEFLKKYIDEKPGGVLDEDGGVVGSHEGATFYTLGQRHGFAVPARTPTKRPLFVVAKDVEKNTLTVSPERAGEKGVMARTDVRVTNTNWIFKRPNLGERYEARLRYRQSLCACTMTEQEGDGAVFAFEEPQASATPGQSLVVYQGEVCLGGGVIANEPEHKKRER